MSGVEIQEEKMDPLLGESGDFVQSQVDSFFPLTEEVIEEHEYGMDMLGAIADAVGDIVGAIMDAFGAVVDRMLRKIKQALTTALNPVLDAWNDWVDGILSAFNESFSMLFDGNPDNNDQFEVTSAAENIMSALFAGNMLMTFGILITAIEWIGTFASPFTSITGITPIVMLAAPLVVMALVGMMGETNESNGLISALTSGDISAVSEALEDALSGIALFESTSGASAEGSPSILAEEDWVAEEAAFVSGMALLLPALYYILQGKVGLISKGISLMVTALGATICYKIDSSTEGAPGDEAAEAGGLVFSLFGVLGFGVSSITSGIPNIKYSTIVYIIEFVLITALFSTSYLIVLM